MMMATWSPRAYCAASDFFASCDCAPCSARSSIPFLWASYSGVPGRGGTPFGRPPAHSGMISITLPTLASCAPLAQEASAVPTINNATRRIMTTDEGTFSIRANYGKLKFKLGHSVLCGHPPKSDFRVLAIYPHQILCKVQRYGSFTRSRPAHENICLNAIALGTRPSQIIPL